MKKITLFAMAVMVSSSAFAQTWSLDKAHAVLGFTIAIIKVADIEGSFKNFDITLTSSMQDFSDAAISVTADINSINTGNEERDAHLKGPYYFDTAEFPTLTFKGKSFTKISGKNYKLTGNLTMHGITKMIMLYVTYNGTTTNSINGKPAACFKVTGTFKRSDFDIDPTTLTTVVSDEVNLIANVEFDWK